MQRIGFGFVVGVIVLLIGASMALNVLFDVHFPLVPIVIATLFITFGSRMIVHSLSRRDRGIRGEAWLADRSFRPTGVLDRDARYDVVFGRGVVDLTRLDEPMADVTVAIETMFGATVVKVDPTIAYDVEGHSMFGEVRMPDRTMTAIGNLSYQKSTDHRPRLHIRIKTVFGACQVVEAPST